MLYGPLTTEFRKCDRQQSCQLSPKHLLCVPFRQFVGHCPRKKLSICLCCPMEPTSPLWSRLGPPEISHYLQRRQSCREDLLTSTGHPSESDHKCYPLEMVCEPLFNSQVAKLRTLWKDIISHREFLGFLMVWRIFISGLCGAFDVTHLSTGTFALESTILHWPWNTNSPWLSCWSMHFQSETWAQAMCSQVKSGLFPTLTTYILNDKHTSRPHTAHTVCKAQLRDFACGHQLHQWESCHHGAQTKSLKTKEQIK